MVYDNLGGNTFFRVTQLANISVNENDNSIFTIYPNPTNDIVSIRLSANMKLISFSLISALGEEIKKMNCIKSVEKEIEFNISNFAKGIYYIKLQYDDKTIYKKVIKQ